MVQLAALALQPSPFDPVRATLAGIRAAGSQIQNAAALQELQMAPERNRLALENARVRNAIAQMELSQAPQLNALALERAQRENALAQLNLTNAQSRAGALSRFAEAGGISSPRALDALSSQPELYTSALQAYTTRQQASAMEAARAAQRVAAYPEGSDERQQAYMIELDKALESGLLDPDRHRQLSLQAPTDLFLQGIISQATPISTEPSFRDILSMPLGGRPTAPAAAAPEAPVVAPPATPAPPLTKAPPSAPASAPTGAPPAASTRGATAPPGTIGESISRILPQGTPAQQARFWTLFSRRETRDDAMKLLQEMESPLTARQRAETEEGLRKEFASLAKPYFDMRDAFSRIEAATANPTAAGDLALIFNFMKLLDPGSVVREGEFATAQNAAGVPDRIINLYNRMVSGERLNNEQRRDFVGQARNLMTAQERQYRAIQSQYLDIARRSGVDPQNVFVDFSQPPPDPRTLLEEARRAIAAGRDPRAVRARLREFGVDDTLLGDSVPGGVGAVPLR